MSDPPSILSKTLGLLLDQGKKGGRNLVETLTGELEREHCLCSAVVHSDDYTCWQLILDPPVLVGILRHGKLIRSVGAMVAYNGVSPEAAAELRKTIESG